YIDFPQVGSKKEAGKQLLTIESVKSAEDVYSPVTGTIVEINEKLSKTPESVNKDPYGSWLVKIKVEKEGPSMNAQEYKKIIG
ncbi:MAG: glycine cleavage system protein H, partial [Thermoplasmata archaeon]